MVPEEDENVYENMGPETWDAVKEGEKAEESAYTATGPEEVEKVYEAIGPETRARASDKENRPPPSEGQINSPAPGAEAEEREMVKAKFILFKRYKIRI